MKISVGTDDYCPVCMEWREYDDNGNCKVCGTSIKKGGARDHKTSDEYDLADFGSESGEE